MILENEDAAIAMQHLLSPDTANVNGKTLCVFHDGKRYAGFRTEAHADWFVRKMGLEGATREMMTDQPSSPGRCGSQG